MTSLDITSSQSPPYVVLHPVGDLDLHTQARLEDAVLTALTSAPVLVDLSGVDFLAISALRSLLLCHQVATSTGQVLLFEQPSRQALRLLAVSGLDAVLPLRSPLAGTPGTPPVTIASPLVSSGGESASLVPG